MHPNDCTKIKLHVIKYGFTNEEFYQLNENTIVSFPRLELLNFLKLP
jgi:hypothetical protein